MNNTINNETYPGKLDFPKLNFLDFGKRHASKLADGAVVVVAAFSPVYAALGGMWLIRSAVVNKHHHRTLHIATGLAGVVALGASLVATRNVIPLSRIAALESMKAAATDIVNNGNKKGRGAASFTATMGISWIPQTYVVHVDAALQRLAFTKPKGVFTIDYSIDGIKTGTAHCIALARRPVSPGPVRAVRCWQAKN